MSRAFDVSPNAFSFGSVISACEKAGASAIKLVKMEDNANGEENLCLQVSGLNLQSVLPFTKVP